LPSLAASLCCLSFGYEGQEAYISLSARISNIYLSSIPKVTYKKKEESLTEEKELYLWEPSPSSLPPLTDTGKSLAFTRVSMSPMNAMT